MSGKEVREDVYKEYQDGVEQTRHINKTLDYIKNKMIPELRLLNSTSILLDSEPIKPELFDFDSKRNELIDSDGSRI